MNRSILRDRLLASTIIAGAMLAPAAAFAQEGPQGTATGSISPTVEPEAGATNADGSDQDGTEIVITGSRIANPNLTSTSPLTVIGSQEIKLQGTTRVEDLVNSLPQTFAGQGSGVSNGSTGTATVDLRGLGAARTLVLINGRRLVPGDPRAPVADLNSIPAALVERVEVLTGGASSVYGSDAISGVVNFVMDSNFEGLQLDAQYGIYQHNNSGDERIRAALGARGFPTPSGNTVDGGAFDASITFGVGTEDGRGHLTAYAGYRKINPVLQANYDYSSCSLGANAATNTFACGGSGTTAPGQFQIFNNNFGQGTAQTLDPASPNGTAFRPYVGARDAFNFAPTNYFQRPDERFTFGAFADYEISEAIKPYLELSFMDDRTIAQIAPSGAFGVQYSIPCDGSNPLISPAQLAVACTGRTGVTPDDPDTAIDESNSVTAFLLRRNVEGGGRQDDLRHTNYRIVAGTKGDFGGNWNYDVYGQFGRTIFEQNYFNDFSITRTNRALDVIDDPSTPGIQAVCRSVVDGTDPSCVPYNVYTLDGVTPEALNYLQTPLFSKGQVTQQIVSGSISNSDLGFQSPLANSGIGFAIGAEYRKESIEFRTDTAFTTGDGAGQGGPTIGLPGTPGFDVKEAFGEVRIPLIDERPFFHELSIEAGYRYSDYSTIGSTDAYKILGNFAPIQEVRFRGGYNRAVRAPNIVELFTPQGNSLFAGSDPCAGATPTFTLAQCQNTGVTPAQYGAIPDNPANQFQQITGGNPLLEPEVADTYSAGVVIAPRGGFLRGFSLSVDYFDIKVENLISTVGAQIILNQCGQTGDPTLCALINRDAVGSLFLSPAGVVANTNVNVGGLRTKGVDIAADYRIPASFGSVNLSFVGTYLDTLSVEPGTVDAATGIDSYECKGRFGVTCGIPAPEWRHKLRATLALQDGISISGNWRYVGRVRDEQRSANPFLAGTTFIAGGVLPAQSYFDLSAIVNIGDTYTLRAGVNNLLDNDPPVTGSASLSGVFGNGNTYPQVYDALGRYFYTGVTLNF